MKKFIAEFKAFALKGNVIDLAVGVIIGGAFQGIVNSLVNDVIMPLISLVTGGLDFANWFVALDGGKYETLAAAQEAGASVLAFGNFISAIINFLIMAVIIFLLVKGINKLTSVGKKEEAPATPTTKVCPYCKSEIAIDAVKCPFCASEQPEDAE